MAPWIVVTAVAVVVLAAATVIWVSVTGRDEQDTATCTSDAVLSVLASPGAVGGITAAAAAFDATRPVARSTCITTAVRAPTDGAAESLLDGSAQDAAGPAVWAAATESEVTALEAQDAALTAGRDDRPEATSPVVLAVGDGDVAALSGITWSDLPQVFTPGARLTLVLPDPAANRASSYALQSVVAGATNAGPASTGAAPAVDAAAVTAAAPALRALAAGTTAPGSTADALGALAPGQVVPVVESELIAWNRDHPDAPLTAVHPGGPTAGDTVLVLQLTAPWVDPTAADAAGRFAGFLRGEQGRQALVDSGLRVDGVSPTTPETRVDATATVPLLAPAGIEVTDQLIEVVSG
ncbi:hypothetical protein GCM10009818_36530 [Nakamurella flavida]